MSAKDGDEIEHERPVSETGIARGLARVRVSGKTLALVVRPNGSTL